MKTAASLIGVTEIPGPRSNPTILGWARSLGKYVGIAYDNDDTAWCGIFTGHVMRVNGHEPPRICVRASEWLKFGQVCPRVIFGAVAVFTRQGGGHVGLIVGHDATHLHILGGNQSNGVNVLRIAKDRLTGMRWPTGVAIPLRPMKTSVFLGPTSVNEA